jgi:site-specific recombinase XerD
MAPRMRSDMGTHVARSPADTDVWQYRLGHDEARTTMGYTHVIGDDHRKVAEQ